MVIVILFTVQFLRHNWDILLKIFIDVAAFTCFPNYCDIMLLTGNKSCEWSVARNTSDLHGI